MENESSHKIRVSWLAGLQDFLVPVAHSLDQLPWHMVSFNDNSTTFGVVSITISVREHQSATNKACLELGYCIIHVGVCY